MADVLLNLGIAAVFTVIGFAVAQAWESYRDRQARKRRERLVEFSRQELAELHETRMASAIERARSALEGDDARTGMDRLAADISRKRVREVLAGIPDEWREFVIEVLYRLDHIHDNVAGEKAARREEFLRKVQQIETIEMLREVEGDR